MVITPGNVKGLLAGLSESLDVLGEDFEASQSVRQNSTTYVVGQMVIPTTSNGYVYRCTVAGTSGIAAPTWPTSNGHTVTDGTITWTTYARNDAAMLARMEAAETEIQRLTGTRLEPTIIKMNPAEGDEYDLEEDPFDYQERHWKGWPRFKTRWRPIISVERVAVEWGEGSGLLSIPLDFVRLRKKLGVISLVPSGSAAAVTVGSGYHLLSWLGGTQRMGIVPQMVAIDYTAGVTDILSNPDYADLRECIVKEAAQRVIEAIIDAISRGATSISLDGLSESADVSGLAEQQRVMRESVEKFVRSYNQTMRAPRMKVL